MENKDELPFAYLGPTVDFNGADIEQSRFHIVIAYKNYIDRMLWANGWDTQSNSSFPWASGKISSPLSSEAIHKVFKENGPDEGTATACALELKPSFGYWTLRGEIMYAYVNCCPDIGSTVTTMSKFYTMPYTLHYSYLKSIAKYLCLIKDWGIKYKRTAEHPKLE